jgi:hypothetical protein
MGDVRSAAGLIDKLPKAAEVLADTTYDSDKFREFLIARGSTTLIKPNLDFSNVSSASGPRIWESGFARTT